MIIRQPGRCRTVTDIESSDFFFKLILKILELLMVELSSKEYKLI